MRCVMARGAGGGRPQVLGTAERRLRVIEAVLSTGDLASAAESVGIHERSIQRYARANPWFDKILTAALARADRMELLVALEQRARFEAGTVPEPPPFEAVLPLGPSVEPEPEPAAPDVLPASYVPKVPAHAEPVDPAPVLVVGVELVGRTAAEFLGVDQDLVDDANKDLARVGLPSVEDISAMVVNIANDRTHPACATVVRELIRGAFGPPQIAQARRILGEARRQRYMPTIDAVATEVPPPPSSGRRTVFVRLPSNGSEAPGTGVSVPDKGAE